MSDSVELPTILEAILFSAGRSMTVEELMEQTGKTRTEVSGQHPHPAIQGLHTHLFCRKAACIIGAFVHHAFALVVAALRC